ncbi:insulinase family protein [Luteimonas sp. SJ-92]|uniref:Insulinase family protein n=1 Tax=Luteimonas salinisoli TaxID=2752307 RepID=A0A853J6W3_9GAMM|nr:pitrilysin family protein [Luteimonas salinisoli]NZA24781.1 insulinase family protein [Luteimonas salinisoli]
MIAVAFVAGAAALPVSAQTRAAEAAVDIPYEQFTLPNGLRVIVHTDRKAPIVAVNIWYHVGSKDEPAGRSGFAHLFEHLMFQSSEHHEGEYFTPFELVGATDMNGTTNSDRTNYFQNVPTTALDMALWMESDRMGHLLGAIDQAALDEQRGVVQNEKRQGQNQPYGQVWELLGKAMYPKGHPYHHSTIGSMNDLNAATLDDVKQWFRAWYGPNNAVLVLAGDIDVETAREKVARHFGHIPAGPEMAQPPVDPAKRDTTTRSTLEDKVPQTRIYRVWNVAETGTVDLDHLQLFAHVLGGSKASRLDRRLLHADRLVDSISTGTWGSQLGSSFMVMANVREGIDPARVEAAIDEELARLIADGPTAAELAQAQTAFRAGFVRGIERIGGFGGKADVLAACAVYEDDPGCFRDSLANIAAATPEDVAAAGRKWLSSGDHVLTVVPGERQEIAEDPAVTPAPFDLPAPDPRYGTTPSAIDRATGVPVTEQFPELRFPELQRATLGNGTQVILAERHDVPVVQLSYEFDGGYSADQGRRLGTSGFAMAMLDEGAGELGALEFADRAESLGASLGAGASLDGGNAYLSALKENLDPSLELFASMVRAPRFDQAEIERVRASWIAGIRQEKARPNGAAMRVLPPLLYGDAHPYAIPFSGTGTEESVAALGREDLVGFHRDWVRPEGATLIVVGDTTLEEIVPLLERHFGDWRGAGAAPQAPAVGDVARPSASRVFLIDQPGAVQANIFVGQVVPSTRDPGATRFDIANAVLGGTFSSRLNMNLREDKHWAYGAYSFSPGAVGPRPWMAFAPVQIDKTVESLQELQREIAAYATGEAPPSAEEVAKIQAQEIRGLPGSYETARAVLSEIGGIVRYGRADDYVLRRRAEIEALTPDRVAAAATTIDPAALTWVVVGDLRQIEQPVRALGLGEVTIVDADGNPVLPDGAAADAP